jgi:methylthioribose-1-phosphate isomerase
MPASWFTLRWEGGALHLLDQRRLPLVETEVACRTARQVVEAIQEMVVRGAPAIGVSAAYGVALSALAHAPLSGSGEDLARRMSDDVRALRLARPTAVNLAWAVDRCERTLAAEAASPASLAAAALVREAVAIHDEDVAACRAIGRHGAGIVPQRATILTHCNAGGLATAGYGTALGVVRGAVEAGREVNVIADETRPFLQGARLTAWELQKDGIPVTLIADVAAASLLRRGDVDLVVVGADRIAANGDTANKIGTYPLALAAREHGVPFYVAAPLSTVDMTLANGSMIPIEERGADEILQLFGTRVAPEGVGVRNPAFDVTPAAMIAGIVTEVGILRPPLEVSLRDAFRGVASRS